MLKEHTSICSKEKVLYSTNNKFGRAGVAKTFGHSGRSCDNPSAVVVRLKLSEINNPDIMLFDKAQYGSDGDSVKEIKIFWKKIVSKGVPLQDFEYNAPTKFFVDSAQIKAMDEGLKAFVDEELRKPIYEGLSYGDLHNEANPERKKLAAKLRKIIYIYIYKGKA